jgi:PPIC-type PPIASE domain
MLRLVMICLLATSLAPAQTQSVPAKPKTPQPATAPKAASPQGTASQPVITIHGVCSARPTAAPKTSARATKAPCTMIITKEQFDALVNALNTSNQSLSPSVRRNFAQAYVELLAFEQAAQKAGEENDPRFAQVMRFVRMRTLADSYRRVLAEKYRNPSPDELQAYYNQNLAKYEEVTLDRILVPAKNSAAQNKDEWEKTAAAAANNLRDRAAKGEDFETLQKEAFTTLGLTTTAPPTALGARRRGTMAREEEDELFALQPGSVSKVRQNPSAHIFYKVETKQTLPLDKVKDEISRELARQNLDKAIKEITGSAHADFDDNYFGPSPSPAAPQPNPAPVAPKP